MQPSLLAEYTFTRPTDTTAYGSGDLIANSTSNASVVPPSWTLPSRLARGWVRVAGVLLRKSTAGVTGATFRLHLLNALPTFVTGGDNSAIATVVATGMGAAGVWQGQLNGVVDSVGADGARVLLTPTDNVPLWIKNPGATLYGILEAKGAYAPGNGETIGLQPLILA